MRLELSVAQDTIEELGARIESHEDALLAEDLSAAVEAAEASDRERDAISEKLEEARQRITELESTNDAQLIEMAALRQREPDISPEEIERMTTRIAELESEADESLIEMARLRKETKEARIRTERLQLEIEQVGIPIEDASAEVRALKERVTEAMETARDAEQKARIAARERDAATARATEAERLRDERNVEAEALRDSVLVLSGKMKFQMYGPGFRDFVLEHPQHSPHYEYYKHDPEDARIHRRSVYRFLVRSQQQPFMTTLNCADPSQQVARRDEAITALQSLALLNNKLMVSMARHFANDLEQSQTDTTSAVTEAFFRTVGRAPNTNEAADLAAYAKQHGLANACRLLFNLNEFSFVD